MPFKNKEKEREYKKRWNKEYYSNNREKEIARTKKRRQELRKWFNEYKRSLKCCQCGENHPSCLEFHHKNIKEKGFSLSDAIEQRCFSRKKIMVEMNKCMVLCANCHRKLHDEYKNK